MSERNKGWRWAKLGESGVAVIIMGQSPPGSTYNSTGYGLPFYQGKADFGESSPTPRVWCSAPKKTAQPGDILLSGRAAVGPTNVADKECCIGRGLSAIRGSVNCITEYLHFFLKHIEPWLSGQGSGSTFKAIGKDKIQAIEIPLPPVAEQERIVEVLRQADAIRRKRAEARRLADQILPALFNRSFCNNRDKCKFLPLHECAFFRSGGTPSRRIGDYWKGDIPWVSPSDMKSLEIEDTEEHITEDAVQKSATSLIEPSTILIVVRSGILAHTFPIAITRSQVAFNQDIKALTPRDGIVLPEFLLWAIKSQSRHILASMVKRGSTVHSIDSERFPDLQIPVPSLTYQQYFIDQANRMYDALERKDSSSAWCDSLFSTLLSRAFTGDLTAGHVIAETDASCL